MWFLFIFFLIEPASFFELPAKCNYFDIYDGTLFFLHENRWTIIKIDTNKIVSEIPVGDGKENTVYSFKLTPFAIYLRMRDCLCRQFLNNGVQEKIYEGDIVSFIITEAGEVVLADRKRKGIIFLDAQFKVRLMIVNPYVVDMDYFDHKIYLLTRKEVVVLDEHGNMIETFRIPGKNERIVAGERIFLFTPGKKRILLKDREWKIFELSHPVIALRLSKEGVLTLNQYGDTLYTYNNSQF
ncbi:MAG: hypothetical protein N3A65_07370 [candidate division WOR-3 bacterium]|nr:hypothetical protein [candidate division WOR-3 bacterium]